MLRPPDLRIYDQSGLEAWKSCCLWLERSVTLFVVVALPVSAEVQVEASYDRSAN
jgi:hypothetical protein